MSKRIQQGFMKIMPLSLIAILVTGLFLFTTVMLLPAVYAEVAASFTVTNNGTSTHKGGDSVVAMELDLPNPASDTSVAGATVAGTQGTATFPAGWSFYGYEGGGTAAFETGNDWIGTDDDSDGVYTSAADTLAIDNADTPAAGATLYDMGATDKFMDSDHGGTYTASEAWVLDDGDGVLTAGALNGTGTDDVLHDGPADIQAFTNEMAMDDSATNDDDYNDGEMIFNDNDTDNEPTAGDTVITAGKADLTNLVLVDYLRFDDSDSDSEYDHGTDDIFYDFDQDGVYTSAADTTKVNQGDTPAAGDTLYDVTTADNVCSDNTDLASATCIYVDTDGTPCDATTGGETYYLGTTCTAPTDTEILTGDNWATTDDTIDGTTDFIKENVAEELTYSSASDVVYFNGSGALSAGDTAGVLGMSSGEREIMYMDSSHDGTWGLTEPIIYVGDAVTLADDADVPLATVFFDPLTNWNLDIIDLQGTTTDLGYVDVNNDSGYDDGEPIIRDTGVTDANLESTDTVVTSGTVTLMTLFADAYAKTDAASDTTTDVYSENVTNEHTYSAAADTTIGGTGPGAGSTLVNMNSAKPAGWTLLLINDAGVAGTWEGGSDMIFNDDDTSGYYNGDALDNIRFGNPGTCVDGDIANFTVYEDTNGSGDYTNGVDAAIATKGGSPFIGQAMAASGSVYTTGSNEQKIFFVVTFAGSPTNGCTFTAKLPSGVSAAQFISGDDGPTDSDVDTTDTITIDSYLVITDGNISIAGATGTGGTYKIGDTVVVTWNAGADGNTDIASATTNLSGWGGGAAVAMEDDGAGGACNDGGAGDDVWCGAYTILAGAVDGVGINATVSAIDNVGNTAGPVSDTTGASVDNIAPIVTDGNISIAGGSGTGGAYIIGNTVVVTWDSATDGNSDTVSALADLSGWGGGGAVGMEDDGAGGACNDGGAGDDVWCAAYTLGAGAIDATNVNATVTATDDAGNSTGPIGDTSNATVDNIAPTIGVPGTIGLTDTSGEGVASIGENLTYAAGTPGAADGDSWTVDLSAYGLSATQAPGVVAVVADDDDGAFSATETLTDNAGNSVGGAATITGGFPIDNVAPVVTDANISIAGGSGTGGAYVPGDTVVVTWDSATDGNADTASAVADLTGWGGGGAVAMEDDGAGGACNDGGAGDDVWCAAYTLGAGAIDATNVNATVTGTDDGGNATGPVADSSNATVDNQAPVATDGNISIAGGSGTGGAYIIGDTVTVTWDAATDGTADAASATADLSGWEGGAAVAMVDDASCGGVASDNVWEACYTLVAGAVDGVNINTTVTPTDDAGNTIAPVADTSNATVDNIAPTIGTPGSLAITLDNNANGVANISDTVTYTDAVAGAADGDTFTVDLTTLTGNAAATSAGSPYTVILGTLTGTQQFTETITDDAGNTATGNTAGLAVDNRSLLSATNVQPASLVQSAIGNVTVTFTTLNALPNNGKIVVTFPAGFTLDTGGATTATANNVYNGTTYQGTATGQVVTLVGDGAGTGVGAGGTVSSLTLSNIQNPAAIGSTGFYDITTKTNGDVIIDLDDAVAADTITSSTPTTQCNDGLDNDGNGLIDYPNDPYCSSATDTLEAYEGGGGGGGGGGGAASSPTSNTTTTTSIADISTITGDQSYSSPIQFDEDDIVVDEDNGTATIKLTGDGSLTLKPNSQSTVSTYFPPNTSVTGPVDWDGRIDPPVLRSLTMISKSGEEIEGSDDLLMRDDVTAIVKVSTNVPLEFSNEVTLTIPLDLPDGSVVLLYTSRDGNTWEVSGEGVVQDGKLVVKTDHFSYFAVVMTDETKTVAEMVKEQAQQGFADIVGHWAEQYINEIYDLGIVSGKTETTYAPNDNITRAELTKIATKAFGIEIDPSPTFSPFGDVALGAWYAPYVIAARNAGIVEGVSEGVFSPNAPITRAAALKIMLESAGFDDIDEEFDTNYASKAGYTYAAFPDVGIGEWFAKYVGYAYDMSIVSGKTATSFAPGDSITRAEVAKIVVKVMELLEQ